MAKVRRVWQADGRFKHEVRRSATIVVVRPQHSRRGPRDGAPRKRLPVHLLRARVASCPLVALMRAGKTVEAQRRADEHSMNLSDYVVGTRTSRGTLLLTRVVYSSPAAIDAGSQHGLSAAEVIVRALRRARSSANGHVVFDSSDRHFDELLALCTDPPLVLDDMCAEEPDFGYALLTHPALSRA